MNQENEIKPTIPIGGLLYFPIDDAAAYLKMSVHSLRRETYGRKVRYLNHVKGLMFLPEWLDEWLRNRIVEPRKKQR